MNAIYSHSYTVQSKDWDCQTITIALNRKAWHAIVETEYLLQWLKENATYQIEDCKNFFSAWIHIPIHLTEQFYDLLDPEHVEPYLGRS